MQVSCFELFKFPNSALRFSNVEVSAHCMLNATLFISHSAEVAKMQHHIYIAFRRSCQTATLKFRELWYQYTILRQTINKQTIKILAKVQMYWSETEWQLENSILCQKNILNKTTSYTWKTATFTQFRKISRHRKIILYLLLLETVDTR